MRLGVLTVLLAVAVLVILLLVRWATGELEHRRAARRRAEARALARRTAPPRPPTRRPATHPAGRRVGPPTDPNLPARRPLEAVAADVRRLTRELAMVPGGMPMARRRGLLAAYDDVLVEAAALLQVDHRLTEVPPEHRELERIRLIGSLEAAGLVVGR
ncbi:hypothetical protein JD78_04249 [Modestobacter roseus]|uniref:Uncharacterized protein n=2 Tax=Modestobacter roseus TaxID=1181884 RepID=A0A562IYK0_9ACTN|nr:hypothetical protein JD78_04249 [Modestobacter roseus]